jgi:hypothetical protein
VCVKAGTAEGNAMRVYRLTNWSKKTPAERDEILREMVQAVDQPPNGELAELDEEIRGFETRLGMDSGTMKARLEAGEIEETLDVCKWLMAIRLRDEIAALSARAD